MAAVDTIVNEFLRDAQFRVAELAIEINNGKAHKRKKYPSIKEKRWRAALLLWMDLLYDAWHGLADSKYNFLHDWTDKEIIAECEYLRYVTGMNPMPGLVWAGYSLTVQIKVTGVAGSGLPAGNEDNYIRYDANGDAVAEPFPSVGGMTTETISQYFS